MSHVLRIFHLPSVASHFPLTMSAVLSSLENVKGKLEMMLFPFEDLPNDRNDPVWDKIEKKCDLTLPELSALKNEVAGTISKSVHPTFAV